MPANAGVQVRFQFKFKNRLDSAGMTGARVDFQSTNSEPLGLEPRVVQFYLNPEFFDFFSAHTSHLTNLSPARLTR
jgi:hypothetical protein